jgi:hypothetical protein
MHIKHITLLFTLIFIYSCGGSGAAAFSFSVGPDKILSTNEDVDLTGSFSVSTNYTSNINYSISTSAKNGTVSIDNSGVFSYLPSPNYFGEDDFAITFNATQIDENQQPVSGPITYTRSVNVTVIPVNDPPFFQIIDLDPSALIYPNEKLSFIVSVGDVDNDISDLTFLSEANNTSLETSFNILTNTVTINPSMLNIGGPIDAVIQVSDGTDSSSKLINFWNLKKLESELSSDMAYTFYGNHESDNRLINYVFVLDALDDESSKSNTINGLMDWLDFIDDGNISYFINNFMNIHVIEVNSDSDADIKVKTGRTVKEENDFDSMTDEEEDNFYENIFSTLGCGLRDDNTYCFNADFVTNVEDFIKNYGIDDIDNISVITATLGRGTACGGCSTPINIQDYYIGTNYPEDVYVRALFLTLKHEFGHSFVTVGDEYTSDYWDPDDNPNGSVNCLPVNDFYDNFIDYDIDEDGSIDEDENEDISRDGTLFDWTGCIWADSYPNTTTVSDPFKLKWSHFVENLDNVPGLDYLTEDADIGMFEGTYFGRKYNYRPSYANVMGGTGDKTPWWFDGINVTATSWDKVGIESFAINALRFQGLHDLDFQFNDTGIAIQLNFIIPNDIFGINWYIDGEIDTSLNDKTDFFVEGLSSGWQKIAYRVYEKNNQNNYLIAIDELDQYAEVYNGAFTSFNQLHYCDAPYSDKPGYEESVCYGTLTAYDLIDENGDINDSNNINSYGGYNLKNFNDFLSFYNDSQTSHWVDYFIEYSGLGGQIGINWSNL